MTLQEKAKQRRRELMEINDRIKALRTEIRALDAQRTALNAPLVTERPEMAGARVVGLCSYPKSGVSWLRAILGAAMGITDWQEARRHLVDTAFEMPLLPVTLGGQRYAFYKTHRMAPLETYGGEALVTERSIVIHRHPLDVFVSYLNFISGKVERISERVTGFEVGSVEEIDPATLERLFSRWIAEGSLRAEKNAFGGWHEHWAAHRARAAAGEAVLFIRYEDLHRDFAATAGRLFAFLEVDGVDIAHVQEVADRMTAQDGGFFWKRQTGTHKAFLSAEQIARFERVYGSELAEMGYA
ncbi:MAG: sulfotransferase domain-containing protein [Pseudomonadota bacterium]